MGGPRTHARGIDGMGNSANTVESEQILVKHLESPEDPLTKRVDIYSFT